MVMQVAAKAACKYKYKYKIYGEGIFKIVHLVIVHLHEDMGVEGIWEVDESKVLVTNPSVALAER